MFIILNRWPIAKGKKPVKSEYTQEASSLIFNVIIEAANRKSVAPKSLIGFNLFRTNRAMGRFVVTARNDRVLGANHRLISVDRYMKKRPKLDPLSVLMSLRQKRTALPAPTLLTSVLSEEIAGFQALSKLFEQSKLMPCLAEKEFTDQGERIVSISEEVLGQHYPGLNPLCDRLPGLDAFIYVYDGITGHGSRKASVKGDVRPFLGERGFRELLIELASACSIHRFCWEHVNPNQVIVEPITKKPTSEARRDAFAILARAKAVFQQIASRLRSEMSALGSEPPQAYRDAYQFTCEIQQTLEPLVRMGKQVRS
jgi:hypothetical protein